MSTLKTVNIGHPSATSPGIVLDAAGGVAVAGMGLVHINTTTFTAVSSVSLNDVFTSEFENYRLFIQVTPANSPATISYRYRASGTDTATGYEYAYVATQAGSLTGVTGTSTAAEIDSGSNSSKRTFIIDCIEPNVATPTQSITLFYNQPNRGGYVGNNQTSSTQFDGFSLLVTSGNITGTIRVYGYNNG